VLAFLKYASMHDWLQFKGPKILAQGYLQPAGQRLIRPGAEIVHRGFTVRPSLRSGRGHVTGNLHKMANA
jgi:hypothetical protein